MTPDRLSLIRTEKGFSGAQYVHVDEHPVAVFKDISKQTAKLSHEIVDRVSIFLAKKYRENKDFTKQDLMNDTDQMILEHMQTQDINKGASPDKSLFREKLAEILCNTLGSDIVPKTEIFNVCIESKAIVGSLHRFIDKTSSYKNLVKEIGIDAFTARADPRSFEDLFLNVDRNKDNVLFSVLEDSPEDSPRYKAIAIDHAIVLPIMNSYGDEDEKPCWFSWESSASPLSELGKLKLKSLDWDSLKNDIEKEFSEESDPDAMNLLCTQIHLFKYLANTPEIDTLTPRNLFDKLDKLSGLLRDKTGKHLILEGMRALAQSNLQSIEELCKGDAFKRLLQDLG